MGFPRFYHPEPISLHHNIKLSESAARHAGLVLRLAVGDEIILFNGDGFDCQAKLIEVTRKAVIVLIQSKIAVNSESPLKLHLVQAIVKPDKMDWVMQKAVELGVNEITPVITKYCAVKITDKKSDHWQGIVTSACEQSGRSTMPKLNKITVFESFLDKTKINSGLIFHPEAELKFSELNMSYKEAVLFIGPEGGFHQDEVKLAENNGFLSVRLGSRILRTETAATAALSVMQSRWGDF
ncbi:MAG TPA: 16S rRNA (uracil(1498)-N(3))-methyltransferase [Gammaproteobacteria bacterium]|nr:16S rRNA (uracil(1498)-N(3))-methyltransferase [Gammaproteobacteria bacterium]